MNNHWTDEIEAILKKLRLNSILLSKHHNTNYFYLVNLLKYFRIPVILLSGVSSILDIILKDYIDIHTASLICCIISLSVGLIGSVELYLNIEKSKEINLHCAKGYSTIASNINKMITLTREQRPIDGMNFLEEQCNEYHKLQDNSTINDQNLNAKLLELNVISSLTEEDEIKLSKDIGYLNKYQKLIFNIPESIHSFVSQKSSSLTMTPRREEVKQDFSPSTRNRKQSLERQFV